MDQQKTFSEKLFLILIASLGGFALIVQFYLFAVNRTVSFSEMVLRYFTFFTILTNILVSFCCVFLISESPSRLKIFFSRQTTLTATTVYISVVGVIYNITLRFLWNPQGMQRVVDELLHLVIPVLFVIYWFVFARKNELQWKNVFWWLLYPLVYFIVVIIRGRFTGYYPYPFIDVSKQGYGPVITNSCVITVAFTILSLLFVGIAKIKKRRAA